MPHVRSVSFGVWIKAGSYTDDTCMGGLAHFLEHMVFKGTETRSCFDIAASLESVGGTLNAFTSRDITCYYAGVLSEHAPLAVDVIADMLQRSQFIPGEIENEKQIVIEEIHASADVPEEFVQDSFSDLLLNPYPESKPILGDEESVKSFTRDDLFSYLHRHYTRPNIVIAAAGNVEHSSLVELVKKHCEFTKDGGAYPTENAPVDKSHVHHIRKNISQAHICCGAQIFGYSDSRRMSLLLLNTILGDGMSSRLFQNIREKHGLAYSIYSFTELFEQRGLIATYAATDSKRLKVTLELLRWELSRLRDERVDDETLSMAKSQVTGNLVIALENPFNRMSRLARQEIYLNDYRDIDDTIEEIQAVTKEELQSLACDIFSEEDLLTVYLSN